jgi:hypothetical protein
MSSQINSIEAINEGGIVRLSDLTHWRVAPGHLKAAAAWAKGAAVEIEQNVHLYWKFKLQNVESGERIYAVPSRTPIRRTRDAYINWPCGFGSPEE